MNNTFNINRFGLLLKRQWLEFGKIYLISLLVALGVIVAFYGTILGSALVEVEPNISLERLLAFREPLFLFLGFLFISIVASSYFAHLGQKPKAIIDLLIPASTFEKFLSSLLYTAVLATVSFVLIFYLADLAFISKLRGMYTEVEKVTPYIDRNGNTISSIDHINYIISKNSSNLIAALYMVPLFITSVFLLGSIYFNRFHYIKTAISVMIFAGAWALIVIKSGELLFRDRVPVKPFHMSNSAFTEQYWSFVILALFTLIFWAITYVRLKEKEV
jgi:hypothetical protein